MSAHSQSSYTSTPRGPASPLDEPAWQAAIADAIDALATPKKGVIYRSVLNGGTIADLTTASATYVMAGAAAVILPQASGNLDVTLSATLHNDTPGDFATIDLCYGIGTPPVAGAAVTGTQAMIARKVPTSTEGGGYPVTLNLSIFDLAIGVAYWIDAAVLAVTGGNAIAENITIAAREF